MGIILTRGVEQYSSFLKDELKDIHDKKIVDLGCGKGSQFVYFLKKYHFMPKRLIHLDANPDSLKFENRKNLRACGDNGLTTIDYIKEHYDDPEMSFVGICYPMIDDLRIGRDAQCLPLKDKSINIVHQNFMFADNQLVDKDSVVSEVYRILKEKGLYLIDDEIPDNIESVGFRKIREMKDSLLKFKLYEKLN
ncbi:MAG: class I SAM-dependent methyltransferase [Nanoarchaeota archaeon]